jgi:hypothetical protein
MSATDRKCAYCGGAGVLRADGGWLCTECATRRVNSPKAREMMQADEDMAQHLDKGGRLS